MLIGCSVEHIFRHELLEGRLHAGVIVHVAHIHHHIGVGEILLHLKAQVMHRRLGLVNKNNLLSLVACHLTHYLAAYRATGASDEHNRIFDV